VTPVIAWLRRRRCSRRQADDQRLLWTLRGGGRNFGYNISRAASLRPGRMYPALTRMEQAGLLHTGWEDKPVHPRRWYQITKEGLDVVRLKSRVDD
jgi:hypothetical protein